MSMNRFDGLLQHIDPNGIKIWRITGAITSLFISMCIYGAMILFAKLQWLQWSWFFFVVTSVFIVIFIFLLVVIIPSILWNIWRYAVNENEIELKYGIVKISRTLIPMTRVQHVDMEQGPLLRQYNLANIKIATAADLHTIPVLSFEEAHELRNKIVRLAGISDDV